MPMHKKNGTMSAADKKAKGKGALKAVPKDKKGLAKLPRAVRNKMGFMSKGGMMGKKNGKKK